MVIPPVSLLVDRLLSRGEGLDERGDPFGPPCTPEEAARLLDAVRAARFPDGGPPFTSPLPPPGGASDFPLIFRPPAKGSRWAILVPPYGGIDPQGRPGLYAMHQRALHQAGFGVALLVPPFHGPRVEPGRPSGWGFVRADLGATSRAIASAAAEVTALARHLREREGATRVAGLGLSLGGAAVGLAAALGAPLDACAFLAAVDNPAAFYATGANRAARRRTLEAAGYDNARVAEGFRPFAPSTYPAPLPPERLLYAVPPHDLVVPAPAQEAWRAAWGGRAVPTWGYGHGTAIASPLLARALARGLAEASP